MLPECLATVVELRENIERHWRGSSDRFFRPATANHNNGKTHSTEKLQEALTDAGKYSIEMSHPQEPSDKMKEEAEVKACCGNDKHQLK
jgi:hypothetical protein